MEEAQMHVEAFGAWAAQEPSSAHSQVALAEAQYWLGLQLADARAPKETQSKAFGAAMEAAQRAQKLDAKNPGGFFWEAVNRAKLAELKGIVASAGELPTLKRLMDKTDSLQPCYFHGGVHRYWGAVITRTPGFLVRLQGRSSADGEDEFKKSLACDPGFLSTRRFWAELKYKDDDKAGAIAMLRDVLKQPAAGKDPANTPWNLHEQRLTRQLLKDWGAAP